jgi:hypothetical protein
MPTPGVIDAHARLYVAELYHHTATGVREKISSSRFALSGPKRVASCSLVRSVSVVV